MFSFFVDMWSFYFIKFIFSVSWWYIKKLTTWTKCVGFSWLFAEYDWNMVFRRNFNYMIYVILDRKWSGMKGVQRGEIMDIKRFHFPPSQSKSHSIKRNKLIFFTFTIKLKQFISFIILIVFQIKTHQRKMPNFRNQIKRN